MNMLTHKLVFYWMMSVYLQLSDSHLGTIYPMSNLIDIWLNTVAKPAEIFIYPCLTLGQAGVNKAGVNKV